MKKGLHGNEQRCLYLKQFWPVYQAELVADPFVPKFYSPIQNNVRPNFGEVLNFVTCEHSFGMNSAVNFPSTRQNFRVRFHSV